METLFVIGQRHQRHQNQFYRKNKSRISDRFGSSPSRGFKGINCRTFQSGDSPEPRKVSSPIPISPKPSLKEAAAAAAGDDFHCSELWAGPAYSISPPPSSLPIPKFSLRQKRSVSLDLPAPPPGVKLRPLSKSAPSSPRRESHSPRAVGFFHNTAATENLRRILNLDNADG